MLITMLAGVSTFIAIIADVVGVVDIIGIDWPRQQVLHVKADSPRGTLFTNKSDLPETYRFFATGSWSYNRYAGLEHNAGGYPERPEALEHYKLPGAPEGALIVRRSSGLYELVGTERELKLESQEKVYFTINDATDGARNQDAYSDNSGTLKVEWTCETCQ